MLVEISKKFSGFNSPPKLVKTLPLRHNPKALDCHDIMYKVNLIIILHRSDASGLF